MKKIGIITFHRALNYGAVLQGYALTKALRDIGFDAEIIDYRSDGLENFYKPFYTKERQSFSGKIKKLIISPVLSKKNKVFCRFAEKHIPLSRLCKTKTELASLSEQYDGIITGSDQVFNPEISTDDYSYFLDFVPTGVKKIAYAASFGNTSFSAEREEKMSRLLKSFDYISVREQAGVDIIKNLCGKTARVLPDPSMLLSKEEWSELAEQPNNIPEKFVLCIIVNNGIHAIKAAREYAQQHKAMVVILNPTIKQQYVSCRDFIRLPTASPAEFLWLVEHADCVFTTSFHGLCFSLIFGKNVYVECYDQSKKSRIDALINDFCLSSRLLPSRDKTDMDYSEIEKILQNKRQQATKEIQAILNNI